MKKLSTFAVAAVTVLSLAAGSTFAWFTTTQTSKAVSVNAANIDFSVSNLLTVGDLTNRLPGEVITLNSGAGSGQIVNKGSRAAIVEIDFGDQTYGKMASNDKSKIPAELQGDYESLTSSDGTSILVMTKDRLAKVMEIKADADTNSSWVKVGNKYYTSIAVNGTADLGKITMTLLGELGGNKKQADGTLSADRQFEQACSFNVAFKAVACQPSEEAIVDQFGQDAASAIKSAHQEWFEFK